jgi:hypothetical protein
MACRGSIPLRIGYCRFLKTICLLLRFRHFLVGPAGNQQDARYGGGYPNGGGVFHVFLLRC